MVLVGSAFILPPDGARGIEHPPGFTGDLDNWHIHLNLCRGNSEGRDDFVTATECEARGGRFHPTIGWMMHAWAEDTRDNQMGVFSMWNPSIAPLADPQFVFDTRNVQREQSNTVRMDSVLATGRDPQIPRLDSPFPESG